MNYYVNNGAGNYIHDQFGELTFFNIFKVLESVEQINFVREYKHERANDNDRQFPKMLENLNS